MADTRKWKPKESSDANKDFIEGSRTGTNETPRKVAEVTHPKGEMRTPERGVGMDNMGNSPANPGATRPKFLQANNVDNAPSVPLSSYDGVSVGENGGVKLEGDFKTMPHDKEMRPKTDQAPKSSSIIGTESSINSIKATDKTWNKASIPIDKKMHNELFTGDGNNASNVEGDDSQKADHSKGQAPFKKAKRGYGDK